MCTLCRYAESVAKILDPTRRYFGDRIGTYCTVLATSGNIVIILIIITTIIIMIIIVVIIDEQCQGQMCLMAARMGTRSPLSASSQVYGSTYCMLWVNLRYS